VHLVPERRAKNKNSMQDLTLNFLRHEKLMIKDST
jgi:hypothetical protein